MSATPGREWRKRDECERRTAEGDAGQAQRAWEGNGVSRCIMHKARGKTVRVPQNGITGAYMLCN